MRIQSLLAAACVAVSAARAHAQYLLACDNTNRRVQLLSDVDGSTVDADFLPDAGGVGYDFLNPYEALQVYDTIWVTDNITDQIVRFDPFGLWLGTVSTGVDEPRGLAVLGERVYVVNGGTGAGSPGRAIVEYDLQGNALGSFPIQNSEDVIARGGELWIGNTPQDAIQRYTTGGLLVGVFYDSDAVTNFDNPRQIVPLTNGNLMVVGNGPPSGLFEFAPDGTPVAQHLTGGGNKGLAQLGDGSYLFTDSANIKRYDPLLGTTTIVQLGVGVNSINPLQPYDTRVVYCTAATTSHGCTPTIAGLGTPNATQSSGFTVRVSAVEGGRQGLIFYGTSGRVCYPWALGSTSFVCVRPPTQRTPTHNAGGTVNACDGTLQLDWNAFVSSTPGALGTPLRPGTLVQAQGWFRDPGAPKTANLSDALEFDVLP